MKALACEYSKYSSALNIEVIGKVLKKKCENWEL